MKKLMLVFLFFLFLGIPKISHAEVMIQRDRTVYYYYDEENKRREIPLFYNYETNMPVFMINFRGDPDGFQMEEIDVSEIPFDEEEIQYIKDVIAIIMEEAIKKQMKILYLEFKFYYGSYGVKKWKSRFDIPSWSLMLLWIIKIK